MPHLLLNNHGRHGSLNFTITNTNKMKNSDQISQIGLSDLADVASVVLVLINLSVTVDENTKSSVSRTLVNLSKF
jgi:hypothetical protein